jgi:hypothetical protein
VDRLFGISLNLIFDVSETSNEQIDVARRMINIGFSGEMFPLKFFDVCLTFEIALLQPIGVELFVTTQVLE